MTFSQTIRPATAFAAFAILASTVIPAGSAPIASPKSFDGGWSVLIVTEKGTCDRAYRYPIKIKNGAVDGAKVKVRPVPHVGANNGYRVELGGAIVAYISDHQMPHDGARL